MRPRKGQNKGGAVMSLLFQQRSNEGSRRLFGEVDSGKNLRLSGLLAFAVFGVVAVAGPANAGCGLTVTFDNDLNT
jgi:hypothetical protein